MGDATTHMHQDIEELKRDIAVIKHILSQEGKLSAYAKEQLAIARRTSESDYISHADLKKRILQ